MNISNTRNRDKIEPPYCRLNKTDNGFVQFKELKGVIQTKCFSPYFHGSFIPLENFLRSCQQGLPIKKNIQILFHTSYHANN